MKGHLMGSFPTAKTLLLPWRASPPGAVGLCSHSVFATVMEVGCICSTSVDRVQYSSLYWRMTIISADVAAELRDASDGAG